MGPDSGRATDFPPTTNPPNCRIFRQTERNCQCLRPLGSSPEPPLDWATPFPNTCLSMATVSQWAPEPSTLRASWPAATLIADSPLSLMLPTPTSEQPL